jgi:hypothetical protein
MRPLKSRQSHLLQPLDEILAAPANVRILRVLGRRRVPISAGELAKSAALSRTSTYPVLRQLERVGVVEFVGAGSQKLVQMSDRHPLARILRELFKAEANRFEALGIALRKLLSNLRRPPLSAWAIEATHGVQLSDMLDLYVVTHPEDLESTTDYLNEHLADIERTFGVHVTIKPLTRSELETLPVSPPTSHDDLVLIAGVPPGALRVRPGVAHTHRTFASHDAHDQRSRRLALAIGAKIRRDPDLIALAESNARRRLRKASPRERRELTEWIRILSTMSPARLERFLVEDNERAIRLRQTLPMLNVLSAAEREAVLRSETDADVIKAVRSDDTR